MAFNLIKGNMQRIFLSANLANNKTADTPMEFNAKIHQNDIATPYLIRLCITVSLGVYIFFTMTLLDNSYVVQVAG